MACHSLSILLWEGTFSSHKMMLRKTINYRNPLIYSDISSMKGLKFKKSVFIFLCTGKGPQVEKRPKWIFCNTTILFGKTTTPASFFLTRIENFFYILFPYQSSMIKNNQARELREKESRRNETMATLYKCTHLNLWKKDSIALQISWKIDLFSLTVKTLSIQL